MEYFNCRICQDIYETHTENDSKSRDELKYARYLGFCSDKCYDNLSEEDKTKENIAAWFLKDSRKRNGMKFKKGNQPSER
tara:strand:+ start:8593 stop:8832 length:240 start_codon:yes stop_codon:yes gene_type:complete